MRISTKMIYESGTRNLQRQQSELYRLQNQMSTGRRILTPSDDPVAAAQALVVTQQKNINQQFLENQGDAASRLAEQEDRLSSISELLQAVRVRVVEAGNGSYNDSDRKTIAAEIRERYDELLGLANSSDAMGNYVFAGTESGKQPFIVTGEPGPRVVSYQGNETRRQLQVATGRIMDVSSSGSEVFMRNFGNGAFTSYTDTGIVPSTSIVGPYDGSTYQVKFLDASNYTVTHTPADGGDPEISRGSFDGSTPISLPPSPAVSQVSLAITGTPAAGSMVTVSPQNIFTTLGQMISALEGNVSGSAAKRTEFQNNMNSVSQQLDQALDNILGLQTSVGARRLELDALSSFATDLDLQYQSNLSSLQDLDYTAAITSMSQRQIAYEAAQATFSKVSQLSLFNYL